MGRHKRVSDKDSYTKAVKGFNTLPNELKTLNVNKKKLKNPFRVDDAKIRQYFFQFFVNEYYCIIVIYCMV